MRRVIVTACVLLVLSVPGAAAAPTVHGWVAPATQALTLPPGGSADLPYQWHVRLEETTCPANTEIGVDFDFEALPPWAGMSFVPAGVVANFTQPSDTERDGASTLEILLDPEGPRPADATITLLVHLNLLAAGGCTPPPHAREDSSTLALRVGDDTSGPSTPTGRTPEDAGRGSPAVPTILTALVLGLAAWRRR